MNKDTYKNFEELIKHEKDGEDFEIEKLYRKSDFAVIAIHGGWIESGTTEVARRIAGGELSFYSFLGTKKHKGNSVLHITSDNFDERECFKLISKHKTVISIHGQESKDEEFVMIGGLDKKLREKVGKMLTGAGFVLKGAEDNLKGENPVNVCNRGTSGAGVQMELSKMLRNRLMSESELMEKFAGAVRGALGITPVEIK